MAGGGECRALPALTEIKAALYITAPRLLCVRLLNSFPSDHIFELIKYIYTYTYIYIYFLNRSGLSERTSDMKETP